MMKKLGIISILIFVASCAFAQSGNTISSLNMWLGAGYANFLHSNLKNVAIFDKNVAVTTLGGVGGIAGLGYGLEYKHFILSVGAEFDFKHSTSKFADFNYQKGRVIDARTGNEIPFGTTITTEIPIVKDGFTDTDASGDNFAMWYEFSKIKDVYSIGYINFPLLTGGKFNNFYFMLGGKFGLNLLAQAKSSSLHSSKGYYEKYIGIFLDMDDHFFRQNVETHDNSNFVLNFNVAASAEIGLTFTLPSKDNSFRELRLALFADYGLLNINRDQENGNGTLFYIPAEHYSGEYDPNTIRHNNLFSSIQSTDYANDAEKYSVNPLLVGVKLTILFQLKSKVKTYCPAIPSRNYPETSRWKQGKHKNY